MRQAMKVEKQSFDAVLQRLISTPVSAKLGIKPVKAKSAAGRNAGARRRKAQRAAQDSK